MAPSSTTHDPKNVVVLNLPGEGNAETYKIDPNKPFQFGFDTADALFTGNGNDLVISTEDGGAIILENYLLLAKDGQVPTFELINGEEAPGDVYLFAFNDETEQLETAANAGTGSSGAGEYTDDASDLFERLSAIGGQNDPSRGGRGDEGRDQFDTFAADSTSTGTGGDENVAPTAAPLNATILEDGTFSISNEVLIRDYINDVDSPDSDLTITELTIGGNPATLTDGNWTFQPALNENGTFDIEYKVSDQADGSNPQTGTGTLTVEAVNDAPTADGADITGSEGETISGQLIAGDLDGTVTSYTLTDADGNPLAAADIPTGFSINSATGAYTFDGASYELTPGDHDLGSIYFVATDDLGATSAPAQLNLAVT
ncbi:MAG: cadherin-like domain-containing protein, partial [Pseudodesulfovibrio sp.]|nr:cadherin-like domain-containing protein [Pseudodesulfovibrio sp.]